MGVEILSKIKQRRGRQRQENLVSASNNLCESGDMKQEEGELSYRGERKGETG